VSSNVCLEAAWFGLDGTLHACLPGGRAALCLRFLVCFGLGLVSFVRVPCFSFCLFLFFLFPRLSFRCVPFCLVRLWFPCLPAPSASFLSRSRFRLLLFRRVASRRVAPRRAVAVGFVVLLQS